MRILFDTTGAEMQERRKDGDNIVASWYSPEYGYCVAVWNRARKQWQTITPFYSNLITFNRYAGVRYGVAINSKHPKNPKTAPSYYFVDRTLVYVDARLDRPHFNAHAGIRFDLDGGVRFVVLTREVVYINPEGWLVTAPNSLCDSPREQYHTDTFLRQYFPSICIDTVVDCCKNNLAYNIYTGETRRRGNSSHPIHGVSHR